MNARTPVDIWMVRIYKIGATFPAVFESQAAALAWDSYFGGTRRFERGDWDWSSHNYIVSAWESRYYDTLTERKMRSEHHGHSLGSCGLGAKIRWAYRAERGVVASAMVSFCYYGQDAGTDKLDLSIMVAAWDSCCYGSRIEQAGSDILEEKQQKNWKYLKSRTLPTFNSTRLSMASCAKSLEHTLGCCLCGFHLVFFFLFGIFFSRLIILLIAHENIKKTEKRLKPLKIPSSPSFDSVTRITSAAWDSCQRGLGPKPEAQDSRRRLSFFVISLVLLFEGRFLSRIFISSHTKI